ncbi:MAG TPA: LamG domain-containing protein, partial [Dongiaceae bacterium]|nr:LamG domain-containing protein [Dongiaceae bacterium]
MNGFNKANLSKNRISWVLLMVLGLALAGCGGGGDTKLSSDPEDNNNTGGGTTTGPYIGPTPATEDVQRFKINFYDTFRAKNRCGSCHNTGGQAPQFVREDDVNLAYAQALSVVDVGNPGASRIVEKVRGGHNCWIDNGAAVCAGDLQRAIERWTGGSSSETTAIELRAPTDHNITVTKQFPLAGQTGYDSVVAAFGTTVYPLFAEYNCNGCHQSGSATPQQPYFASADLNEAYDAARSRMDIDDGVMNRPLAESLSRFVVRLRSEFHNCGNDCMADAQEMLDAIKTLSNQVPSPSAIPSNWVTSKAMVLEADGILASGGGRVDTGAIAQWDFAEGEGILAGDSSGIEPRMNLTLFGAVTWVGGNGIQIKKGGRAQATTSTSKKLSDQIKLTGEFSIEAWVAPANVTQEGPARIVTYSSGSDERNFTLGQTQYRYDFMNRASTTNGNGEPSLTTDADDEDLQATLQHVVVTYSPVTGRRIYVNGVYTGDADTVDGGNINGWDDGFAFMLGSESSGAQQWEGVIRFVSIYNRVLEPTEIVTNFDAGVGEKYYLMFNVTDLVDIDDGFNSYVVFETSVFDSYSYLFNKPFLYRVRAEGTEQDAEQDSYSNIPVAGMRIGINGKEPNVGQAYGKLNTNLDSSQYGDMGQVLANIGTILPLEGGSNADEFFLTFERIGDNTDVRVEGTVSPIPPSATDAEPDIGLRNFAEISASMSKITGVPVTNANVVTTYNTVKQALPSSSAVETFVSAQQMGVAQLAIEYCSAMVDDTSLRSAFFPSFTNFNTPVASALDTPTEQNQIINPLFDKVAGGVGSQPGDAEMKAELA